MARSTQHSIGIPIREASVIGFSVCLSVSLFVCLFVYLFVCNIFSNFQCSRVGPQSQPLPLVSFISLGHLINNLELQYSDYTSEDDVDNVNDMK